MPPSLDLYVDRGKVPWPEPVGASTLPGALVASSLQDRDFEVGEALNLLKGMVLARRQTG